jgi:hypothetical protein
MLKKLIIIIAVILVGGGLVYYSLAQKPESQENKLIKVENPQPNETIQSPYTIKGQARGNWYFEATFPVKLLDENGNIIKETFAQAQSDWMTENFVPFESVLSFSVAKDQKGTLILQKDNPSGLPENDAQISISVFLKASK